MGVLLGALFALSGPAAAENGGAGSNNGGVTYRPAEETSAISLVVARGAWVGRATRIRGVARGRAGETLAIQERRGPRRPWARVASARVGADDTFALRWKPRRAGRRQLRAVAAAASTATADDGADRRSAVSRLTVYRGVRATWYGPGLYGNRTACGQRLTTRTIGVAHRTLPCGARVALRSGGRSTVVRVIDRGPFVRGVAYDLTSATANRLGAKRTGRIGVAVLSR